MIRVLSQVLATVLVYWLEKFLFCASNILIPIDGLCVAVTNTWYSEKNESIPDTGNAIHLQGIWHKKAYQVKDKQKCHWLNDHELIVPYFVPQNRTSNGNKYRIVFDISNHQWFIGTMHWYEYMDRKPVCSQGSELVRSQWIPTASKRYNFIGHQFALFKIAVLPVVIFPRSQAIAESVIL